MKINIMYSAFFVLLFSTISSTSSLDLLGLSISVPEQNLVDVLTGSKSSTTGFTRDHFSLIQTTEKYTEPFKCPKSETTINGGQSVCESTLIFEEYFNRGSLNSTKWIQEQYIPQEPDFEFVTYEKRAQNCYMKNGHLHLKATIRDDPLISKLDLNRGCTGKKCSLTPLGTIVPPLVAGKIKSKFSFLYGKVEIRAKLPRGDWIYPELYLEPKGYTYGDGYKSGRIWLAYSRGNVDLQTADTNAQIGNTVLYSGAVLSDTEPERTHSIVTVNSDSESFWSDDFHVFTLIWSPDGISVEIDEAEQGFISASFSNSGVPYSHLWTTDMAPFDKEFILSFGIGVGGHSDFPERCVTSGIKKPWKKTSAKPALLFYKDKDNWFPTWDSNQSTLKIDYVKIWSL